jgi:polysaccharide biosynthesis/export protein
MRVIGVSRFSLVVLIVMLPAGAMAQASRTASAPESSPAPQIQSGKPAEEPSPAFAERNPRYQLQREDVVAITFPLSPELNQTVTVQPDGYISLQNAGGLFVQGMTVPQLVDAVKKAYANILHDPIVDVDLKDYQKPYFIVSGQVSKPGRYDLRYDTTLAQAVALGGGLAPTAKTQVFLFHRVSSGWLEVKQFNLKDTLNGKTLEDPLIKPGDMIVVPEKFIAKFRKYVPYSLGVSMNPTTALF